jgi:hypothetical protein
VLPQRPGEKRALVPSHDLSSSNAALPPSGAYPGAAGLAVSALEAGLAALLEPPRGASTAGAASSPLAAARAACDALGDVFAAFAKDDASKERRVRVPPARIRPTTAAALLAPRDVNAGQVMDSQCCLACGVLADAVGALPLAVVVALPVPELLPKDADDVKAASRGCCSDSNLGGSGRGSPRGTGAVVALPWERRPSPGNSGGVGGSGVGGSGVGGSGVGVPPHRRTAAHVALELRRAAATGHWSLVQLLQRRLAAWLANVATIAAAHPDNPPSRSGGGGRAQAAFDSLDPDVEV